MGKTPNKKQFKIRKVPLETFLTLLNSLFMDGADYVDLHAEVTDDNINFDSVTVSVPVEYMSKESKEDISQKNPNTHYENFEEEDDEKKAFTLEEILDLLNGQ